MVIGVFECHIFAVKTKDHFMKKLLCLAALALVLSSCATAGQNRYGWQDVGKATEVEFGRVIKSRAVDIDGKKNNAGAAVGAMSGGIAGAGIGRDGVGAATGILAGAIIGAIIDDAMSHRKGVEYTIALRTELNKRKNITIVQELPEGDVILPKGARVIVQTSGEYQRVLPADDMPTQVSKAKDIEQVDEDQPKPKKSKKKAEKAPDA